VKYCEACHSSYPGDFTTCPKDQSPLRSITELMPGLVLREKYEILERLGAGGMGTVYKARHTAFGEMRAIKVIDSHLIHDDEFLARSGAKRSWPEALHPNVVRVEDLDSTEDGRPFIVMEYVVGRSLRTSSEGARLPRPGPWTSWPRPAPPSPPPTPSASCTAT
jgi:serine/threonine protein kinase